MNERIPGKCPEETALTDNAKSYCDAWGRWTNCREVGHCVHESVNGGGKRDEGLREPLQRRDHL